MATIDVSDCCLVCADPLEWTGVGVCGHKEICSRCVARMRFVLKDNNCVLCKQDSPAVFFTRFMGDYTARVPAEDYPAKLKERASRGELKYCAAVDGYFDDPKHFDEISALCGYTHPILDSAPPGKPLPPRFTNLADMKKYVDTNFKLNFCDICMKGRKVFVCEQLLYNKSQLERHNRDGDEEGPLAGSSFKGHPLCRFCRQRFYDSQELWKHMEAAHENCFLCRRAHPDKYVYYRHYKELEDHFRVDHFMCPHPRCLDKKFVVFETEQEMKRHFATEHGDELKMSRAQRREASSVAIPLQYREGGRDPEAEAAALTAAMLAAPGVTIGGGHNVGSRHGPRGGAMHHSRSEPQMQSALQASYETAQAEAGGRGDPDADPDSLTFSAHDFPSVGAAYGAAGAGTMRPVGLWGGGPSTSSSGAGPSGASGQLRNEDFPALPSMSKAQKKKLSEQNRSLAQRLSAAAAPPRVVNRAMPAAGYGSAQQAPVPSAASFPPLGTSASGSGGMPSYSAPDPAPTPASSFARGPSAAFEPAPAPTPAASGANDWPGLPATSSSSSSSRQPPTTQASSSSAAAARFFALAAGPSGASAVPSAPSSAALLQPQQQAPPALDDFPALPVAPKSAKKKGKGSAAGAGSKNTAAGSGAAGSAAAGAASSGAAVVGDATELASSALAAAPPSPQGPSAASIAAAAAYKAATERAAAARAADSAASRAVASPPPPPSAADFPSLAQVAVATALGAARPASAAPAAASSSSTSASAGVAAVATGGISESLKAANRALVEKIKAQLSNDKKFEVFKKDSGEFQRGGISAQTYHDRMLGLGLLALVPEVAALCPNPEKQSQLMSAHMAFLDSPAANDVQRLGGGWVPPEAALAAARQAEESKCWGCPRCTLINAPSSSSCEACGFRNARDEFPALGNLSSGPSAGAGPSSSSSSGAGEQQGGKGKGKGSKSKGTVISIGMPRQGSARNVPPPQPAAPPPSVWGQQDNKALKAQVEQQRQLLTQQQASQRGQWTQSGGTKLARTIAAINDAWGPN